MIITAFTNAILTGMMQFFVTLAVIFKDCNWFNCYFWLIWYKKVTLEVKSMIITGLTMLLLANVLQKCLSGSYNQ